MADHGFDLPREEMIAILNACPAEPLGHLVESMEKASKWFQSDLCKTLVQGIAAKHGLIGDIELKVMSDGTLRVVGKRRRPKLKDLRKRAKELGVDISQFGRKVSAIEAFLAQIVERKGTISPDEVVVHEDLGKGFMKFGDARPLRTSE